MTKSSTLAARNLKDRWTEKQISIRIQTQEGTVGDNAYSCKLKLFGLEC